jgi:hypothetical protein
MSGLRIGVYVLPAQNLTIIDLCLDFRASGVYFQAGEWARTVNRRSVRKIRSPPRVLALQRRERVHPRPNRALEP